MGPMKYAYQRGGAPLLQWKDGPPRQTRAADSVALGSTLSEPTLSMPLPRPGAPEPLGCGCSSGSNGGNYVFELLPDSFLGGLVAGWLLFTFLNRRNSP